MTVTIAGGGPAGALAACLLARAGQPPLVLERDTGPADKVCGEFLSHEAQQRLAAIGVDIAALGASDIRAMRLVEGRTVAESRLPFRGAGLSRRVMDEALLQRAAALGAEVRRGARIRSVNGLQLDVDGTAMSAQTLFLATGKHDLRGAPRKLAQAPESMIGFKQHFRLSAAQTASLAGHVEVVIFGDGYAGLQLIDDGIANLCLLSDRERFDAAGQDWPAFLDGLSRDAPHLARRLDGARPVQDRPLSVFRVPYGHVHDPAAPGHPAVFRLGDQAAVIPSFCGDGMAIALHSAALAVATHLAGGDAAVFHRALRADVGGAVRLAFTMYRAARTPALRALMVGACARWPGLLRAAAIRTRVPEAALRRAA